MASGLRTTVWAGRRASPLRWCRELVADMKPRPSQRPLITRLRTSPYRIGTNPSERRTMSRMPRVTAAAAAAILTTKHAADQEQERFGGQRFFVHQHIEHLPVDDPALTSYIADIYHSDRKAPIDAVIQPVPNGTTFTSLATPANVIASTTQIALNLQEAMESKSAKPGIVFGFTLEIADQNGYGVIKADLEDDRRFFLNVDNNNTWSLSQVRDILPPPQKKFAKYAISPRPRQPGAVGIRDKQAEPDSAADYFLQAMGLVVPRRSGTKLVLANAAIRSGYGDKHIQDSLAQVQVDTPVSDVIERFFPNIPDDLHRRLSGTPERPMMRIIADDPYCRKFSTSNPRFQLIADESVNVTVEGRTITVELPVNSESVNLSYVR